MLKDRFAATLAEKHFISNKDISRAQLALLHRGNEPVRLRERPHQKPSISRNPPEDSKPESAQIAAKDVRRLASLLQRKSRGRLKSGIAREKDKKDSDREPCPGCQLKKLS